MIGCAVGACWLTAQARLGPTFVLAVLAMVLLRVAGAFSPRGAWRATRSRSPQHVLVYVPVRLAGLAWLVASALTARGVWSAAVTLGFLACVATAVLHLTFVAKEDGWDFMP